MSELLWTRYPLDILPDGITGDFGEDYGGYKHRGTDVGVVRGTPVFAPAAGTSINFTNDGSFGKAVCLLHPDTGWCSLYAHLDYVDVGVGQEVRAGQRIGLSGNTGYSFGPHLHWQVSTSPSFPLDIRMSRDAMKVPFVGEEDDAMTPAQEELLLKVASVVGGWSTGQEFQSVDEALPSFRAFEDNDQRILIGMGLLNGSLNNVISALTAHLDAVHGERPSEDIEGALASAREALEVITLTSQNYPEEPTT